MDRDAQPVLTWLREPDEMTLAFNPYGLGGRLAPEDAADFQMASIARAVLAEDVPENVRENFERARKLHLYGVLEYEFFTAASDYALLVLEGALRVRFLTYYSDGIPVLRSHVEETLQPESFDDIRDARGVKLSGADGRAHRLPVSGGALLEWARRERLLPGTRSRIVDGALSDLRNHAAHPVTHSIGMPPESARTLGDVAEMINRLWGHDTPGGRLFPAPVQREVRVAAVAPNGGGARELWLEQVREATDDEQRWHYAVFLVAEPDRLIGVTRGGVGFLHEPGFQTTEYPCEQLWQGDWGTLVKEIDGGAFTGANDAVRHLDRLFFIRASKGELDRSRSPADLLALATVPTGVWYAVIADSPLHAWVHVRDHEPDVVNGREVCPECFVQIKARGEPGAQMQVLARRSHHQR
jgi:hypothetical protein